MRRIPTGAPPRAHILTIRPPRKERFLRISNGWSHHFYYDRIHSLSVGYVDRTCWTSPFQPETSRRAKVVEVDTRLRRGHFPSKCARSKSDLARAHVVGGRRLPRWSISTFPNTRPSAGKPPRPRPREQPSVQMRAAAPVEIAIQALSHAIDDRLRPIEAPSRVTPRICSGSGQSRDMVPARCGAFPGAAERGRRVGRSRRGDRDGPGGLVAVK